MRKHSRSTVLGLAVLGLAFIAAPAFAVNLFTVNSTEEEGVAGSKLFVPGFIAANDPVGVTGGNDIYIPYLGTMTPCKALIGGFSGGEGNGCARWGEASIEAWAKGLYYDPRFGTPFIPPSGDHHRTGYRLLLQPSFSGGAWLSGFAPLGQRFPFFPEVGNAGPGGDVGIALANASAEAGINGIMELADAHGEPLTTGKFPRYWAHERAAWVDTLMVKYTAGSPGGNAGSKFTQSLRSSVGFAREVTKYRWRAMSNVDGHMVNTVNINGAGTEGTASDGCGDSGWCEFYAKDVGGNIALYVVKNADGNTDTDATSGETGDTAVEITESTRLDTMAALTNGGKVLKTYKLNNLEKLPTLIDDRLAQVDTNLDGTKEVGESWGVNGATAEPGQALFSQFQVVSGPNVHSEEGADPYAFVICGSRSMLYGEEKCAELTANTKGALDFGGAVFAIVYNSNSVGNLGDSVLKRFGMDLNPARILQNGPGGNPDGLDSDTTQDPGVYVLCKAGGGSTTVNGITYQHNDCESSPGDDGMYGTADDGTIYYKEATENGLRGWIRETNGHAFSFLGADTDGNHNGSTPANFGLTTMMQQNIEGFLMSCLGCNPHALPFNQETVTYQFDWPGNFNINDFPHPPDATTTIVILNKQAP